MQESQKPQKSQKPQDWLNKISLNGTIADKQLTLEAGYLAGQAHGAVLARYGDTVVLATVVTAKAKEDMDYFPLYVEYEEKLYAGGVIKGSRFVKREGRPREEAVLNARLIDRSVRPLFPDDFRQELQIVVTVLSVDSEYDPVFTGLVAVSAALEISGVPWEGPIGMARIGLRVEGDSQDAELMVNPAINNEASRMDLFVSALKDGVVMVEMGGQEIPEETVLKGIGLGQSVAGEVIELIEEFSARVLDELGHGYQYEPEDLESESEQESKEQEKEVLDRVGQYIRNNLPAAVLDFAQDKEKREAAEEKFREELYAEFEGKTSKNKMDELYKTYLKGRVRELILTEGSRPDGRALDEVRPIDIKLGTLPRTHGSAVFTRGQTQALTISTLGSTSLEQLIESMTGEETKRYIHHYNFPPYSVGEVGRIGYPKRREIGHGALAERALLPLIPPKEDFPYTIRVVSEIMSSNGSTSMAAVCGSSLSLLDAGVPIKKSVAGVAMGLMKDGDTQVILTDIIGVEDFYGDMDFKVAGTRDGITAMQMDVKVEGITDEILREALEQARAGREHILNEMRKAIESPREGLSEYAPKIETIKISPKKIGDVIGPGGKVIRSIQEQTSTEIDVQEDGTVHVAGVSREGVDRALEQVRLLTTEVEVGDVYEGKVTRVLDFGAFVQILPGQEGLVHISELRPGYVSDIYQEVQEGETMRVKVIEIDDQGRINLSRKQMMGDG